MTQQTTMFPHGIFYVQIKAEKSESFYVTGSDLQL